MPKINRLFYNRVYLAGPMDLAPDFGVGWRQMVQKKLNDLDLIFFDPCYKPMLPGYEEPELENHERRKYLKLHEDWDTIANDMRIIRSIDLRLSDLSDWAIVHLDLNIYSTGTHEEITNMNRRKIPVLLHMEQGARAVPDWIRGELPFQHIFGTWNDLFNYVYHVAYSPGPIDLLKRWRFFDYGKLYGMTTIPLSQEKSVKISPEDYKYLTQWTWYSNGARMEYVIGNCQKKKVGNRIRRILMHKLIASRMGLKLGPRQQIDHINGDTLDNRRENLRPATPSQNNQNQNLRKNSSTGVKGVSLTKRGDYHAYCAVNGKRRFSKHYKTLEEASREVKKARKRLHGEFKNDG